MIITPQIDINKMSIKDKITLVRKSKGYLVELLNGCTIDDNLDLSYLSMLTYVPERLKISGGFLLCDCFNLKKISNGLSIVGRLTLSGCSNLEELSDDLEVGENLVLWGCNKLKEVPKSIKVGGDIFLPEHLKGK